MLDVEGERAKRRQVRKASEFVPQNSSGQNGTGEARKIVAEKLGVAHPKVTQAAAVVKVIDEMEQAGDKRGAAQVEQSICPMGQIGSGSGLYASRAVWALSGRRLA